MSSSGRAAPHVAVRISPAAWREEVERFDRRSPSRAAAERERKHLVQDGLSIAGLQRCAAEGPDGTKLEGLVKVYVPITTGPASQRPFGFVLSPGRDARGAYLAFVSFGERHPRPGTRSVYERAHSDSTAATPISSPGAATATAHASVTRCCSAPQGPCATVAGGADRALAQEGWSASRSVLVERLAKPTPSASGRFGFAQALAGRNDASAGRVVVRVGHIAGS